MSKQKAADLVIGSGIVQKWLNNINWVPPPLQSLFQSILDWFETEQEGWQIDYLHNPRKHLELVYSFKCIYVVHCKNHINPAEDRWFKFEI